ncbi:hypothetical protein MLD38_011518 [Melastoma candidum]|uniref:Uncharacterized protein n=1 Tax=Melastoma candidum TaxID=119954 RepID=A0ACB9R3C7_9MYRT|nr:hypothetical protein MLD38_011518 [Melastoma candidum]
MELSSGCGRAMKRRRVFSKSKLLIGQRVEVWSDDDGFCGSWHEGRVISLDRRKRGVEYNHILTEDGTRKLVNFVEVSAAVDGFISDDFYDGDSCIRGFIRPLPPSLVFGPQDLHYGLCVDVFYNDGWWEGVVFDHEEGDKYRKVFFPDLGDEQMAMCGSKSIRITQDWDEKDDSWKSRGQWTFLEVIDKCREEWPLVVSVKQIWYDLRGKDEFRNFDWICTDKVLWEKLVAEVISENLNIVAAAMLPLFYNPGDSENYDSKYELPGLTSSLRGPILQSHSEESLREEDHSLSDDPSPPSSLYSPQAVIEYFNLNPKDRQDTHTDRIKQKRMNAKKCLAANGWTFSHMERRGYQVPVYISRDGRLFQSLTKACEFCINRGLLSLCPDDADTGQQEPAENRNLGMTTETVACLDKLKAEMSWPARVLRSTKRVRKEVTRPNQANPKALLSWLIDKNIILPREKLSCRRDANSPTLAIGRASRLGIKCGCCQAVFSLRAFVDHAGITGSRPASRIFLADGRSLLDCQLQALCGKGSSLSTKESGNSRRRSDCHKDESDDICTVCHDGGEMILCDQCPSTFHVKCVGLREVPDGEWFCPTCCCFSCNQRQFKQTFVGSTDGDIFHCHRYHIGCLRAKGTDRPESIHEGRRYCSISCEKISENLDMLLEKAVTAGKDNLTWTLLKCPERDDASHDAPQTEAEAEIQSRLHLALDVMQECFETIEEPFTNSDLIEDVIFNRRSPLHRLNFCGFYTVLLERNDELISVATIRIYGKRVAEVPLVGTRLQHRRHGMCRVLINMLEMVLKILGVERLVLPAVPGVLNTWTTSFGFKEMTESERADLRGFTFLDFQGTIMCSKQLQGDL